MIDSVQHSTLFSTDKPDEPYFHAWWCANGA
jgi:hypothetical protein